MSDRDSRLNGVAPVERQTLGDRIYESLRQAIISGDLKPGQRVTERELAQQMNVSTTPVREAFRRLSAIGLISIAPWSGALIKGISQQDIVQVAQCREVLEGLACRLAAQRIDDAGLERLQVLVEQAESEPNIGRFSEIDSEIHGLILEYSGNDRLASVLTGLTEVGRFYRDLVTANVGRIEEMRREYGEILAALCNRDDEQAEFAMRRHIGKSLSFYGDVNHSGSRRDGEQP